LNVSDSIIARDGVYLVIDKESGRFQEKLLDNLGKDEIVKVFPRTMYLVSGWAKDGSRFEGSEN